MKPTLGHVQGQQKLKNVCDLHTLTLAKTVKYAYNYIKHGENGGNNVLRVIIKFQTWNNIIGGTNEGVA